MGAGGLRRCGAWGGLAAVALIAGCAEELGPERWETTRVAGVVTMGKIPVTRGWVEFLPIDGTVGTMRSAPLGPDGSFVVEGVAVGVNRIGIDGALVGIPAAFRQRFDPLCSLIRRPIRSPASGPIRVDLLEEYARWYPAQPPGR